jgi:hypothetical protein
MRRSPATRFRCSRFTGITDCCARTAKGHATAAPSRVVNSRRLTGPPSTMTGTDYQMISHRPPAIAAPQLRLPQWVNSVGSSALAGNHHTTGLPRNLTRFECSAETQRMLALLSN